MKFISEEFKFTGMRKPQDFVIYPCLATDENVRIQSDNRMVRIDLVTGGAEMRKDTGPYQPMAITGTDLERVKLMRDRMAEVTNADRTLTILG